MMICTSSSRWRYDRNDNSTQSGSHMIRSASLQWSILRHKEIHVPSNNSRVRVCGLHNLQLLIRISCFISMRGFLHIDIYVQHWCGLIELKNDRKSLKGMTNSVCTCHQTITHWRLNLHMHVLNVKHPSRHDIFLNQFFATPLSFRRRHAWK